MELSFVSAIVPARSQRMGRGEPLAPSLAFSKDLNIFILGLTSPEVHLGLQESSAGLPVVLSASLLQTAVFSQGLCCSPRWSCGRAEESSSCSADPQSPVSFSLSLSDSVSCSLECSLSHLSKKESFPLCPPTPSPPRGNLFPFFFLANSLSLLRVPIFKILSMVLQSLGSGRK